MSKASQFSAYMRARQVRSSADDRAEREKAEREKAEREKARTYNTPESFYGVSQEASNAARDYFSRNQSNPAVGAAGADLAYNSLTAAFQRESDANYARTMTPLALEYQKGAQAIASEARDREIASQGREDYRRAELESGTRRYESDQSLTGQREGYQSTERQIGLTGRESRETLGRETDETLRLRRDARGAIRESGRRFYG